MEEADNMLITTIRETINLPEHVFTLNDIKVQEIILLCFGMLEYFQIDTSEIRKMGKVQRFRSMTKLNQYLAKHLESEFQLNDLMNPSTVFVRKMLLFFITKISSVQPNEQNLNQQSLNRRQNKQNKKKKNYFDKWINDQWIHPQLRQKPIKNQFYKFKVQLTKQSYKRNLLNQLINPHIKGNVLTIFSTSLISQKARQKQIIQNQGIHRRQNQQIAKLLYKISQKNCQEWKKNQKDIKKNKKLKKQLFRIDQQSQENNNNKNISTFQKQVQKITDQKKIKLQLSPQFQNSQNSTSQSYLQNPIERIKRQAQLKKKQLQKLIYQIIKQLKGRKQNMEQLQKKKQILQQKMIKNQQKINQIKQQNSQLKKQLQKKQIIINCYDNNTNFQEEVKKLENDVTELQGQAKIQVQSIQNDIKNIQNHGKEKLDILNDLKIKLNKIQTDYKRVIEQIVQKEQLKKKVKIAKSGISRLYYSKKISEMESRWRDAQKETKKIKIALEELRQNTRKAAGQVSRIETQIQNIFNNDRNKSQPQSKQLKGIFDKFKQTFKKTMNYLEKINQVKKQTYEYQTKVHILAGKSYVKNIEKLKFALEDLKKQVNDLKNKNK